MKEYLLSMIIGTLLWAGIVCAARFVSMPGDQLWDASISGLCIGALAFLLARIHRL